MAESTNGTAVGEKASPPVDEREIRRSVIEPRQEGDGPFSSSYSSDIVWFAAASADEIPAWGRQAKLRDRKLREFWPTESLFASALEAVCGRNAAFSWDIDGPPRTAARVHDMLLSANMGNGWLDFVTKVSIDLYTQDHGAFIEIVRETDSADSAVIALNHLDAMRCWHTGIPELPVLYQDRLGKWHLLKWYQVATLSEMPTPIETLYGLQYCALTRVLRAAQIIRNIDVYKDEKTGGRHSRGLHIVRGVSTQGIQAALNMGQAAADNQGMQRFITTPVMGMVDSANELQHVLIDFVSLPDNYNEEEAFKQYIARMALAFGIDYQDLAPLPGGGLGTSSQSQILHLKSRGKGPAMFMKLIAHLMNQRILPRNVEFRWQEQDEEAEKTQAEIKDIRAKTRQARIISGEITTQVARQIAHDEGDLDEEYLDQMGDADITEDVVLEDDLPDETQVGDQTDDATVRSGDEGPGGPLSTVRSPTRPVRGVTPNVTQSDATKALADRVVADAPLARREKTALSDLLQTRIHKAFTMAADDLAALGYMTTDERIDLSGIIGDTLRYFAMGMDGELPWFRNVDVEREDIRELVEQVKETKSEAARVEAVSAERLALDEEFVEKMAPLFATMGDDVLRVLRRA